MPKTIAALSNLSAFSLLPRQLPSCTPSASVSPDHSHRRPHEFHLPPITSPPCPLTNPPSNMHQNAVSLNHDRLATSMAQFAPRIDNDNDTPGARYPSRLLAGL